LRFCNVKNLMGNHDKYLVSGMDCPRSKSANRIIEYQRQVITNENRKWLANSAMSLELDGLSLVHGGWDDPLEEYLYVVNEEYFAERSGVYFFSGHTHFQIYKSFSGKFYCNPGSVGQPRDGDSRAAYAIFDQGHVTLRRVNYKIDSIAEEMKKEGFEPYY
jgi:predicted phosphodiesterase